MTQVCNFIINYDEENDTFSKWKDITDQDVDLMIKDKSFENMFIIKHDRTLISQLETFLIDITTFESTDFFIFRRLKLYVNKEINKYYKILYITVRHQCERCTKYINIYPKKKKKYKYYFKFSQKVQIDCDYFKFAIQARKYKKDSFSQFQLNMNPTKNYAFTMLFM